MTALANFSHLARGGKPVTQKHGILPDTKSPGVALTALFPIQSYFNHTISIADPTLALAAAGILTQSQNEPIVNSTLLKSNTGGYSFGLHPSSQTPVAVQPILGGQTGSPQTVILRPGQIYRPHGKPDGTPGFFSGFNWGIPFGWLGGGVATLYVFPSPDADVAWPGNAEVLFHRQAIRVISLTEAAALAEVPFNWPLRFPWPHAASAFIDPTVAVPQPGNPIISISKPTRIEMSLRNGTVITPWTMRMLFRGTTDFDDGSLTPGYCRYVDYVWGSYASPVGGIFANNNWPIVELTGEMCRIAADDGGLVFVNIDGGVDHDNEQVDVVRYGEI